MSKWHTAVRGIDVGGDLEPLAARLNEQGLPHCIDAGPITPGCWASDTDGDGKKTNSSVGWEMFCQW